MSISKSWNGGTVTVPERTNKAWGDYTTDALVKVIDGAIADADVVNDLTTGGATKVLSAEQGKTLKTQVDTKQDAATAVTEASAAAGAGNVMVSGGADRTIQDSGVAFSGVARGTSLTADNVITGNGTNTVKDSGVAVANIPTMSANGTSGNLLKSAGSDKTVSDAGVVAANVVTATGTLTSGDIVTGAGSKGAQASGIPVAGIAVQSVQASTGSLLTGTTAIPFDNTIPQSTEGDQYLTLSITPKLSSSKIHVEALINIAHTSSGNAIIMALFVDSNANASACGSVTCTGVSFCHQIRVSFDYTNSSTASKTFKMRAGSASGATTTVNGSGGSAFLGGTFATYIRATEYAS